MAHPLTIADAAVAVSADLKQYDADLRKAETSGRASSNRLVSALRSDFGRAVAEGFGVGAGITGFNLLATGIAKVKDFLVDVVHAGIEEEASISRLGASLKANVPYWDGYTGAMERRMQAGIKLGFADEEQRASLARLVAATHDAGEAERVMAVAMDLARFKRISLEEATQALITVEAGQFRVLKSLGIVLKDGATQQDALNAVQKVANGQAAEYASTVEGRLIVAQTNFNEKMDELGAKTLPLVAGGLDLVTHGLEGWGSLLDFIAWKSQTIASHPFLGSGAPDTSVAAWQQWKVLQQQLDDADDLWKQSIARNAALASRTKEQIAIEIRDALAALDGMAMDTELHAKVAAKDVFLVFDQALNGIEDAWRMGGEGAVEALAKGIHDRRAKPLDAFTAMQESLKNQLSGFQEWVRLKGQLFSKDFATGINSPDPETKAKAITFFDFAVTRMLQLGGQAEIQGILTSKDFAKGLNSPDAETRKFYEQAKAAFEARLAELTGSAAAAGASSGAAFAAAYKAKVLAMTRAQLVANFSVSPKGDIPDVPGTYASGGIRMPGQASWVGELGRELSIPLGPELIIPHNQSERLAGLGGGIQVTIQSIDASGHSNPAAVGQAVQLAVEGAMTAALRDQRSRMEGP